MLRDLKHSFRIWLRDPSFTLIAVDLADALTKLGRQEEARAGYERYLELWPQSPRRTEIEEILRRLKTPE